MARVLVVDDSPSVRKVVERALEGRGVEVLSAATGAEAIGRIERERPDLIVCDVILPDKDGYQVCQFVRTHPLVADTPVLLVSGVVNSTVLTRAADVQSSDVMFKPFAADELVRKVASLLHDADRARVAAPLPPPAPPDIRPAPAVAPNAAGVAAAPDRDVIAPGGTPVASAPADPDGPGAGLAARVESLAAAAGAPLVALVDREGFLIASAGELALEAEAAGALAACLAEASAGIGRELGQGALLGVVLEFEGGVLLLHGVGSSAVLAVAVSDVAALGKVRYFVRKALPELERDR